MRNTASASPSWCRAFPETLRKAACMCDGPTRDKEHQVASSMMVLKRFGMAGFAFFLIKGLIWLGFAAAALVAAGT